jgi:hypothetical protein
VLKNKFHVLRNVNDLDLKVAEHLKPDKKLHTRGRSILKCTHRSIEFVALGAAEGLQGLPIVLDTNY